jgi:hypothetical protein
MDRLREKHQDEAKGLLTRVESEGQAMSVSLADLEANSTAGVSPLKMLVVLLAALGSVAAPVPVVNHTSSDLVLPGNGAVAKPWGHGGNFLFPPTNRWVQGPHPPGDSLFDEYSTEVANQVEHELESRGGRTGGELVEAGGPTDVVKFDQVLPTDGDGKEPTQELEERRAEDPRWTPVLKKILSAVLNHVGNELDGAGKRGEEIKTPWVDLRLSKFQVDHVDAKDVHYHWREDNIRLDINDFQLDLQLGFDKLKLVKVIPTLANKWWDKARDATLLVKVRGGVRASFNQQDGVWVPDVIIDGEGIGLPPNLNVDLSLDVNKGLNWVDKTVLPAILPFIKAFLQDEIQKALTNWSTKDKLGQMVMKTHNGLFKYWWKNKGESKGSVHHEGEECRIRGHCSDGQCGFCGTGMCCKAGVFSGGCDGSGHANLHVCVPPPRTLGPHGLPPEATALDLDWALFT